MALVAHAPALPSLTLHEGLAKFIVALLTTWLMLMLLSGGSSRGAQQQLLDRPAGLAIETAMGGPYGRTI